MGKPRAVRNRKSEMTSCWVCVIFVAIVFCVKNFLIGFDMTSMFNIVVLIVFAVWLIAAVFYTIEYKKWKKDHTDL